MIDVSLGLQAGQGDEGLPAVPAELPLRAISAILQRGWQGSHLPSPARSPDGAGPRQRVLLGKGARQPQWDRRDALPAQAQKVPVLVGDVALFPHLEVVEGKMVCDDSASQPSARR